MAGSDLDNISRSYRLIKRRIQGTVVPDVGSVQICVVAESPRWCGDVQYGAVVKSQTAANRRETKNNDPENDNFPCSLFWFEVNPVVRFTIDEDQPNVVHI